MALNIKVMHAWFINSLFHKMTNKCKALSINLLMWTWKLGFTNNIIIVKCQEIEYFSRQFAVRLTILRQNLPDVFSFKC